MSRVFRRSASAIVVGVGTLLVSGAAFAQNTGFDWNGFYAGVHIGGGWGEEHDDLSDALGVGSGGDQEPPPPPPADSFDLDGVIGGVHAGFDWQHGALVLGIEGMFDGSGVGGDHDQDAEISINDLSSLIIDGNLSFDQRWQAAFVGKAGVAFDRLQLYGLGGLAVSDARLRFSGETELCSDGCGDPVPFDNSDRQVFLGWTAGAGGQYAFGQHWSAVVEGRYSDYDGETFSLSGLDVDADFHLFTVTGGISYHF